MAKKPHNWKLKKLKDKTNPHRDRVGGKEVMRFVYAITDPETGGEFEEEHMRELDSFAITEDQLVAEAVQRGREFATRYDNARIDPVAVGAKVAARLAAG